ncbi:helix-turn-helix transcriptional regulator [Fusobacterium sp.]|uniref:helix-turn-helix domain-containing protein n=1 Tax=Fusobacterium sp. TaxID=68766 RepID=UPI00260DC61A|nr:helix-turn-helix transcriptional regulator [Fusobacterium sp.]
MKYYNIIKEKRDNKGFTTRELGEKVGVSGSYISMIENNKLTNPPSDEVLEKICKELSFTKEEKEFFYELLDEEFLPKRVIEKIHKLKNKTQDKILKNISNDSELQKELSTLTVEEQEKVLKFIKEFIKK